jgi:hypothetical protein
VERNVQSLKVGGVGVTVASWIGQTRSDIRLPAINGKHSCDGRPASRQFGRTADHAIPCYYVLVFCPVLFTMRLTSLTDLLHFTCQSIWFIPYWELIRSGNSYRELIDFFDRESACSKTATCAGQQTQTYINACSGIRVHDPSVCEGEESRPWSDQYTHKLPRRIGFEPESYHVGFVVDKVVLRKVFSECFRFPLQSSHPLVHIHHHHLSSWGAGTIGQ